MSKQPTRRRFLATSATTAAAAATVAAHSLPIARAAHAAGAGTIKIGMIGCGGRCSGAAAESLRAGPDVQLVAMYDVFADRVQRALKHLKNGAPNQIAVDQDHCFTDFDGYRKVIEAADVVLIACASKFHPMYSEAAIRAGKHVFVEKPHGIDPVGVRRMQAACDLAKEKGLSIVSGLQSRYHRGYQETIARIHDGAIGDIVAMQPMFLRGPYQLEERQPGYTEIQFQFRNWYHFRWLSGDDVPQSLVHNMDRMSWIMREEMPEWCFGLAGRASSFGEVYGDMFDHHTVVYEYQSGARAYALCRTEIGCYNNAGDIVMGTKGECLLDRCQIRGETDWRYEGPHNNPYEAEQKALMDAVRSGNPINNGNYMANSTMATVMGQIACYTGKPTRWEDVCQSDLEYGPSPDEASFETEPPTLPDATGNYPLPFPGITKELS